MSSNLINTDVNDSTATPSRVTANVARTATQLIPAYVITEFYDSFINDLSEKQYGALAAVLLLGTSWIQNVIESRRGKAFLR